MGSTWRPITPPKGRALALVCMTVILSAMSVVVVSLRLYLRVWKDRRVRRWGWDDVSAFVALTLYLALSALTILGAFTGAGVPPEDLSLANQRLGRMYFTLCEMFYLVTQACVKTSIGIMIASTSCVTARSRATVWLIVAISVFSFIGTFIWLFTSCRPVSAHWDTTAKGVCHKEGYAVGTSLVFAVSALTDGAFAIVLIWAVWSLQMPSRNRIALIIIFSLGFLAVVACVARFPFVQDMVKEESPAFLYKTVWVVMMTFAEVSIGMIAGSMPFVGKFFHFYKAPSASPQQAVLAAQTIGGTPFDPPGRPVSLTLVPKGLGVNTTHVSSPSSQRQATGERDGYRQIRVETSFSSLGIQEPV